VGCLEGKVAIVTGAGQGIGRAEAVALAAEGAAVVVNDLGADLAGKAHDASGAPEVVGLIEGAGGRAVVNADDVASYAGAERVVADALDHFGRLDVLVNNAGILRDRMSFNMAEEDFDDVVRVHLKGHFSMARTATGASVTRRAMTSSAAS
jgi:NAD(P)-dependent dehydrogenase (short-subunit alcohol dehydrogenase family)